MVADGLERGRDREYRWRRCAEGVVPRSRATRTYVCLSAFSSPSLIPSQPWQLVFHSGHLAAQRDDFVGLTNVLLDSIPPSSALASPILRNTLAQVGRTTRGDKDTSYVLAAPIVARRAQLAQQPTVYLHRAAQRAVLGMGGGAAMGSGACWAGVAGAMGGMPDGGTAAAAAVLGALAGVRWGIGLWERAVGRWWADWRRVGEGMGRDLQVRCGKGRLVRDSRKLRLSGGVGGECG